MLNRCLALLVNAPCARVLARILIENDWVKGRLVVLLRLFLLVKFGLHLVRFLLEDLLVASCLFFCNLLSTRLLHFNF